MPERSKLPELYDITPEVSENTAVFPGDLPFKRRVSLDFERGDAFVLSSIETTVHIGAHCDAPNHYHPKGVGIHERDPSLYVGPCQVITVHLPRGRRIKFEDIAHVKITAKRVLFKTGSFPNPNNWNADFNALSGPLIEMLAAQGVVLVGLDTPSIDPADDEELESHQAVYKNNLAVLEGVVLDRVNDGVYTLIALPLKLRDADASPVRAVLVRGTLTETEEVLWKK